MKALRSFNRAILPALLLNSVIVYGQLFTQNFNSSGVLSTYINSASPTNGQFNAIGTSGAGTAVNINANSLRFTKTDNAGSYSRTTDFSPIPTSLIYKFDVTISGNSNAETTAAVWQVGNNFGIANSTESNIDTHSKIGLNISAVPGNFSLRNIGGGTNSSIFSGLQTVTWFINNSGAILNYTAPNATDQTVSNDKFDVWIGNTQVFDEVNVTTSSVNLTDLKFAFTNGFATIDIDNITIDTFPGTTPTIFTGGISSLSGFLYNEGAGPSSSQNFILSGTNLSPVSSNITVNPPLNYEISTDNISFISSDITVSYNTGTLPLSPPTKIYVRLKAGLSASTYTDEKITISGGTASSLQVTCNGTVTKPTLVLGTITGTALNYSLGTGPSSSANVTVAGTNLNGTVTIIPNEPTQWEVSTDNGTWTNSVTYIPVGGTLLGSGNKIYIRLKSGLAAGLYAGLITASSANTVDKTLSFSGEVLQPMITLNTLPQNLSISGFSYNLAQGPSSSQNFRVDGSNLGSDITATASSNWEISSNATYDGSNVSPYNTVVSAKSLANEVNNKSIYIRLKNGLAVGTYSGTTTLTSSNAVTRTVTLSGEVIPAVVDMKVKGGTGTIADGSLITAGFNNTLFGAQNIGDSQSKSFTITNLGGLPLIIGEIYLGGAGLIDFSVINNPPPGTVLIQGQSATFDIKFAPTTTGAKSAILNIESNDPDNNPYDFAIGGNATYCGTTGIILLAKQGFETTSLYSELTYTSSEGGTPGPQTGFSFGTSASGDRPATNNLYFEGARGYRVQGGDLASSKIPSSIVFIFDAIDTSNYTGLELALNIAAFSLGSNTNGMDDLDAAGIHTLIDADKLDYFMIEISPDNGLSWYVQSKLVSDEDNLAWGFNTAVAILGSRDYAPNNTLTYFKSTTAQPYNKITITKLPSVSQLKIRITAQDNAPNESWILDDVKLLSTGLVPKVWNGFVWSPSAPVKSDKIIINTGNYNSTSAAGTLQVCQCEVKNGATLTVSAAHPVIVSDQLVNNGGITVENDANFVQVNESAINSGTGTFTVKRNSNLKHLDYTYWSSPVQGQNLKTFSAGTLNSRFYTYDEGTDLFESINPVSNVFGNNKENVFESRAKGYAIRANNNYLPANPPNPAPMQVFSGVFSGTANNGAVTFPLKFQSLPAGDGYNLVGNPYASNIDFYKIANNNRAVMQKTAYFWTNQNPNPVMQGSNYPGGGYYNNYAILNGTGGIPATLGTDVAIKSATPTQIIKVGQGFLVKAKQSGNLVFKNAVRTEVSNAIFFNKDQNRKTENTPDRFWLHLTTPLQVVTTVLIGYIEEATDEYDADYDAELFVLGTDALFTKVSDKKLGIQGRTYPLKNMDVVALGTHHYAHGIYTFTLGESGGVFTTGQNVYLKDKKTGTVTNLSEENYSFTTTELLTEDRFEIRYLPEHILGTATAKEKDLLLYREGSDYQLKSAKTIAVVEVYEPSGRLVQKVEPNQKEVRLEGSTWLNGLYILKITRKEEILTRKIRK